MPLFQSYSEWADSEQILDWLIIWKILFEGTTIFTSGQIWTRDRKVGSANSTSVLPLTLQKHNRTKGFGKK